MRLLLDCWLFLILVRCWRVLLHRARHGGESHPGCSSCSGCELDDVGRRGLPRRGPPHLDWHLCGWTVFKSSGPSPRQSPTFHSRLERSTSPGFAQTLGTFRNELLFASWKPANISGHFISSYLTYSIPFCLRRQPADHPPSSPAHPTLQPLRRYQQFRLTAPPRHELENMNQPWA